ncbi:general substrate transporter [Cucurbitaria berberidis CBS 394.84]|uniref:General substrate transporter n=1 Tax=Cucurbitaria berberidis CBS 394.84 TaxID=1168544 RepID=A0A9P4GMC8_9PLEO|nr:general substrate transporter [Cucurbitaria berberidis CBS 394.84]KAF1849048.1 general substrate transporter [Cucurbitaria berberidis CBS 394.84]
MITFTTNSRFPWALNMLGHFLPTRATTRLLAVSLFFGVASLAWGYNIGIMASIYVHPGFQKSLNHPSKGMTGFITSIYYFGTLVSYLFIAHPLADQYGRRLAAAAGALTTIIGAVLQTGAKDSHGVEAMVVGRIVCGIGLAIVSTSVPLYQSEVSPAKNRGRYVVINHLGLVVGLATAFWVGYGISHWETTRGTYYGWRLSMALQLIPETLFLGGVFVCPESPRWLVEHGRGAAARNSLAWLRAMDPTHEEIINEVHEIEQDVQRRKVESSQSWTALFTHRPLFNRLWRASLLQFMAQMCGNVSLKYYLPTVLMGLGVPRKTTLLIGGIELTFKIGFTIVDTWLVDHYGRSPTLVASCLVMGIALMLNGALPIAYPNNVNHAADYTCIAFIFVYTFAFSIGFGPAAWVYGSEIFPTNFRARGLNLAASGSSIGAIISSQIWPIGMQTIGSKTHFIFMSTNLVSGIVIWLFYPETSGRSLEAMEALFDKSYIPRTPLANELDQYHDDDDSEGHYDEGDEEVDATFSETGRMHHELI